MLKLLTSNEVRARTSLSRSALYSIEDFPPPIKVGAGSTRQAAARWIESEIDEWIKQRIELRNNKMGVTL